MAHCAWQILQERCLQSPTGRPWTSHVNSISMAVLDEDVRAWFRHANGTHHSHMRVASVATQIDDEVLAATCAATAATPDLPAPLIEYVAPASAVTRDEPSPVIDFVAPAHAVNFASPAPVIEYVASVLSREGHSGWKRHLARPEFARNRKRDACTCCLLRNTSSSDRICDAVTPSPAVTFETPVPVIEYVTPSPVIEYTSTISDFCYVQSAVSSCIHHGSRHRWCQP